MSLFSSESITDPFIPLVGLNVCHGSLSSLRRSAYDSSDTLARASGSGRALLSGARSALLSNAARQEREERRSEAEGAAFAFVGFSPTISDGGTYIPPSRLGDPLSRQRRVPRLRLPARSWRANTPSIAARPSLHRRAGSLLVGRQDEGARRAKSCGACHRGSSRFASARSSCVCRGFRPLLPRRFGHPVRLWGALLAAERSEDEIKRFSSWQGAERV
jgi:hypothetical protein